MAWLEKLECGRFFKDGHCFSHYTYYPVQRKFDENSACKMSHFSTADSKLLAILRCLHNMRSCKICRVLVEGE